MASKAFNDVLGAAIADFAEHGYDSAERLAYWERQLRLAAEAEAGSAQDHQALLRRALARIMERQLSPATVARVHPGVSRFTVDRLRPDLRGALDRRILASANLIRLNRPQAVDKTLQRFSGWATAQPEGGGAKVDKRRVKKEISKPLTQLPFEERRVLIDQGHKLAANISETVAEGANAIGGLWHSNWRQVNYNYRVDHKERDGLFYRVPGSWADERGLLSGPTVDDVTRPAEEPFCRCQYRWVYALRDVPRGNLTPRGEAELDEARRRVRAMVGA